MALLLLLLSACYYEQIPVVTANHVDPDQMAYSVESDLGLHCLPITCLRLFQLK